MTEAGAPEAASAYRRAAEERLGRYRTSEALDLAQTGLGLARDSADRAELTLLKARIFLELGRAREATTTFREALALDLTPQSECSARIGLASALRILDDIAGALGQLETAQRLSLENDWPGAPIDVITSVGTSFSRPDASTSAMRNTALRLKRPSAPEISRRRRERWAAWATRNTFEAA